MHNFSIIKCKDGLTVKKTVISERIYFKSPPSLLLLQAVNNTDLILLQSIPFFHHTFSCAARQNKSSGSLHVNEDLVQSADH